MKAALRLTCFFAVGSCVLALNSCSGKSKNQRDIGVDSPLEAEALPQQDIDLGMESQSSTVTRDNAAVALSLSAPVAQLLGPEALHQVYASVFGPNPRENSTVEWFRNKALVPARLKNNPKFVYFSPEEFSSLGGTLTESIWAPYGNERALRQGDARIVHSKNLNPSYLRALRAFLGDACKNLVQREMNAGEKAESNVLYTGSALNPEKWASFFERLSGLNPKSAPGADIKPYLDAFPAMLPAPMPTEKQTQNALMVVAYVHLCVALASDVRVIVR